MIKLNKITVKILQLKINLLLVRNQSERMYFCHKNTRWDHVKLDVNKKRTENISEKQIGNFYVKCNF